MICPVCRDPNGQWTNVDKYRLKPEEMCVCETCGFCSYPKRYKSKSEIVEYYKQEYRAAPNITAIYTGERKLQYHGHFLGEILAGWRESKKPVLVTDIGSAAGIFLNWVKHQVPQAELMGVELTTSYVRNAWHLYGIRSYDEFDDTKKYDLISSYKSLEHILDPDVELARYIAALKDDGYLYLAVPLWFEALKNFGLGGFDIEYYYSPNHINTWTRKHVEGLIKVAGGEIVKENNTYYEATYLIRRNESLKTSDRSVCYEKPDHIKNCLRLVFEANEAWQTGDVKRALETWPNFPPLWSVYYEGNRAKFDELGFDGLYNEVCLKAIESCPDEADVHFLAADICARYEQYEKAIEHLKVANDLRPNLPNVFNLLMNCYRTLGKKAKDPKVKLKWWEQSRHAAKILGDISSQAKPEAITWIMFDNANIPTPWESSG